MDDRPMKKQKLTKDATFTSFEQRSTELVEGEDFAGYLTPPVRSAAEHSSRRSSHLRSHRTHASLHRRRQASKQARAGTSTFDTKEPNHTILDEQSDVYARNPQGDGQEPSPAAAPPVESVADTPLIPMVLSAANLEASESPNLLPSSSIQQQAASGPPYYRPLTAITNIPFSYGIGPDPTTSSVPTTFSSSTISSIPTPSTPIGTTSVTSTPTQSSTPSSASTPSTTSQAPSSTPTTSQSAAISTTTSTAPGAGSVSDNGQISSNSQSDDHGSSPTPKIVGGVVGGVVGLILLLLLALLLLRFLKRRKYGPARGLRSGEPEPTEGPQMGEAAPAAAGGLGIMQRMSRSKAETPVVPAERGFQRLSGRKLPSQFSPGMEGPTRDSPAAYPSGSSAYPSGGTFLTDATDAPLNGAWGSTPTPPPDSPGVATRAALAALSGQTVEGSTSNPQGLMAGPGRTPTLQQGERQVSQLASVSRTTPTPTLPSNAGHTPPLTALRPVLGRNPSSLDGSRSSRFLEEVN